jgi:hypothetical protein
LYFLNTRKYPCSSKTAGGESRFYLSAEKLFENIADIFENNNQIFKEVCLPSVGGVAVFFGHR